MTPSDLDDAPTRVFTPETRATATVVTPRGRDATTRKRTAVAVVLLACTSIAGVTLVTSRARPAIAPSVPVAPPAAPPSAPVRPPDASPAPDPIADVSATEAARHLASGDLATARAAYRALALAHPEHPVFGEIARRLQRDARARCDRRRMEGRSCD